MAYLIVLCVCIKILTIGDMKKVFINLCQSNRIPSPRPITADELMELLRMEKEHSYRVPMSISELRKHDLKGQMATVCDVAIHPDFLAIILANQLFSDFMVQIIIEALDAKYNVQLDGGQCVFMKNRRQLGTLAKHRIQKRDIQTVYDSYETPDDRSKSMLNELDNRVVKKRLIEELPASAANSMPTVLLPIASNLRLNNEETLLLAECHLPDVIKSSDIQLYMNEDRIRVHVPILKQMLDEYLPRNVDADRTTAHWLPDQSLLIVEMPLK